MRWERTPFFGFAVVLLVACACVASKAQDKTEPRAPAVSSAVSSELSAATNAAINGELQESKTVKTPEQDVPASRDSAKEDSAKEDSAKEDSEVSVAKPTLVLKNATIYSVDGRSPFLGSVVIAGDKILSVGEISSDLGDAEVIDLAGMHLTPGLIESRGKVWLTAAAMAESNSKAGLNVVDAIDSWSEDWRELAAQGITASYVQPSSGSFLGGFGAVLRVGPMGAVDQVVLKPEVAVQASVGLTGRSSKDRYVQLQSLEKLLKTAKEKLEKADKSGSDSAESKSEKAEESADGSGEKTDSDEEADESAAEEEKKSGDDSDVDSTTQTLMRILKKEIPLFVEARHSDSIEGVLRLAKEYDFRLVLDGVGKDRSVGQTLRKSGVPFCFDPTGDQDGDCWLGQLVESSPLWTLSGFPKDARSSRLLRTQAAMVIQNGVSREEALKAITVNAARMLGVSDRVGTVSVGKDADLAVFAGDPLDPSSATRLVICGGKVTYRRDDVSVTGLTSEIAANQIADSEGEASEGKAGEVGIEHVLPVQLPSEYILQAKQVWLGDQFSAASIHVKDGKVVAVMNGDLQASDLPVYLLNQGLIAPGMVVHSSLGQAASIEDSVESDTTWLRAVDAIDPTNEKCRDFLSNGFVHIGVGPGLKNTSAGLIGHLRLGSSSYVAEPEIASQFVLQGSARDAERFPSSLNGQLQILKGLLSGQPIPTRLYVSSALADAFAKQREAIIVGLKDRSSKAVFLVENDLEVRSALNLIKQYQLDAVIGGSGLLGKWGDALKESKVALLIPELQGDEYQAQVQQLATIGGSGVPIAFAGESAEKVRMTASLLASVGLAQSVILDGMSGGGAKVLGMSSVGIEKDSPADFVIWSGSPLDLSSRILSVIVDGQIVAEK